MKSPVARINTVARAVANQALRCVDMPFSLLPKNQNQKLLRMQHTLYVLWLIFRCEILTA